MSEEEQQAQRQAQDAASQQEQDAIVQRARESTGNAEALTGFMSRQVETASTQQGVENVQTSATHAKARDCQQQPGRQKEAKC